ncbi:hypothetical protein D9M69_467500 [compost metagenome]
MAVGGIGWRVRQDHAGQRVEIAQTGTGQFQAQVQGAEVQRIGQGAGQFDAGIGDFYLCLKRKRPCRVLQRQQPANLALAREFLAVVLAVDLEGECIVLG